MGRRPGTLPLAVAMATFIGSCSDDVVPESCRVNADCAATRSGFNLSCLGGECVETCERDADCQEDDPTRICESLVCVAGCAAGTCDSGMCLANGRCALFFESFEPGPGETGVSLPGLRDRREQPWDDNLGREKWNNASRIMFEGVAGCGLETEDERCAGPAADGKFFLLVRRVKTPERGFPGASGFTCAACKCCRDCRDRLAQNYPYIPDDGGTCLGAPIDQEPAPICMDEIPMECQDVCDRCDQCPQAPVERVGEGLNQCELQAAQKACPVCLEYELCLAMAEESLERCLADAMTPEEAAACHEKANEDREACGNGSPCLACEIYYRLRLDPGIDPQVYRSATSSCAAQGDNGCFLTPLEIQRTALTEDEQSIVSPVVPEVAGVEGNLLLQLDYIAFDVGETYTRVVQGMPRDAWPKEPQEVVIELCGEDCDLPSSWAVGVFSSDGLASVPSDLERNNGLRVRQQNAADWSIHRRSIVIPPEMRTAEFRFRFHPRLADGAGIGFDNLVIKVLEK